ncbi:MAG: VOC family protein [Spongiibacteraceae bacterium]|nr:VOC family protein [Spongiibacteraceae bacterium]
MSIHLRQICLVADKLQPAIDKLSAVFSIPSCYVDPAVGKFGLENTLLAMGSQFIEVVAPIKQGTAAGRFLQRRRGNGGYMVICQVPTIKEQAELRERAVDNKVRIAYESDLGTWNVMQLHPADMGATFFEVDWDQQANMKGNWHPAGGSRWQPLNSTNVVKAITAVELQSDDPNALALHWSKITEVPVTEKEGNPIVSLANTDLRFVHSHDKRGAGLGGLDLKVVDKTRLLKQANAQGIEVIGNQLTICGTRFKLVN